MGLYERWILPRLTDLSMRQKVLGPYRSRAVAGAFGRVLEVGIGSGRNLAFYPREATEIIGVDPSAELLRMAEREARRTQRHVQLIERSAEEIPLDDQAADTAVVSWSLCTVPDPIAALREVRRILKPSGQLFFVEHGWSPEPKVQAWQNRLTPIWRRCAGGCHLNRKVDRIIREAGFAVLDLHTGYAKGPRAMAFMYEGRASPA